MSAVALTWVATSYLLAAAVFLVPFGRIADIRGRKKVFLYGMWVFSAASLLCALAPSTLALISFRTMQGFGSAMIFGTSIALLTSVYPPQERGKVFGLTISITYIGLSAGPVVGGFLTSFFGWRSLFVVLLPIAALIIWVASTRLKGDWADAKGESFDLAGSVIYALSLTAVIIGFSFLLEMPGAILLLAGIAGVAAFAVWESRTKSPVLDMRLFRFNRPFAFSNLAALINYSATFAVSFLVSLYLLYVKEFSPETTGLILVSQTIVMAAFSPLAGRMSDYIEPRLISSVGMAITTLGLVLVSLLTASSEVIVIVADLAVLGFGFALFSSPNTNAIMSAVEKRQYGIASSTVGTMRLVGQVLSMGIATVFIAVYVGSAEITVESAEGFMEAFQPAFATFAAMCLVGVVASLARGNVRPKVDKL
jgi:EmrB/QacA subfamily drug resistance transporter